MHRGTASLDFICGSASNVPSMPLFSSALAICLFSLHESLGTGVNKNLSPKGLVIIPANWEKHWIFQATKAQRPDPDPWWRISCPIHPTQRILQAWNTRNTVALWLLPKVADSSEQRKKKALLWGNLPGKQGRHGGKFSSCRTNAMIKDKIKAKGQN